MFEIHERRRHRSVTDLVPLLAGQFLAELEPLSRLPTVRQLAAELKSSPASIHAAVLRLEEAGAIEIETRGRSGAFLVNKSVGRLWAIVGEGPLVIAFPLASSPRYEGLATAVKQLLAGAGLEVFAIFVRGSRQRLQSVHDRRSHLAVMSSFAATALCGHGDEVVAEFLPHSYNTGHRLFYRAGTDGTQPLRVIVDLYSADQQLLTGLEFDGRQVKLLPAMTTQIVRLLEDGQADAAVWTADEMETRRSSGVLGRSLSDNVRERVGDRDTRAVLVGSVGQASVLRKAIAALDPQEVERIQLDVMEGRTVPEY